MLVCPQCQCENPNNNLFCQHCGESLTYIHCHSCGEKVAFSDSNCPNCGARTGSLWLAIVSGGELEKGSYLDIGQRYSIEETIDGRAARVLDRQPLQKSALKVLLDDRSELIEFEGSENNWLPALVTPYLLLKDYVPAVPELHDAWREENREIVLLEDRGSWPALKETLTDSEIPVSQLLFWFDEMAKLWNPLEEAGCCRSLAVQENLCLDEDKNLVLRQLLADEPEKKVGLSILAGIWRQLLPDNEDDRIAKLGELLDGIETGTPDGIDGIRSRLHAIADEEVIFDLEDAADIQGLEEDSSGFDLLEKDRIEDSSITGLGEEGEDLLTAVIPKRLLSLSDAGATDIGRLRRHNEDCFGCISEVWKQQNNQGQSVRARGLYIVCDGMGGHDHGEIASALAVESLQNYFQARHGDTMPSPDAIERGILLANSTIYQENQKKESYGSGRMGTTLVMALIRDTKIAIAHVGDSRVYRIDRGRGLQQLTVDHEVGQQAIADGIEPRIAYSRPDAYQLTQALGPHDNNYVRPDIYQFEVREDTLLLLCSDGLCDNDLVEVHWQTHLAPLLSSSISLEDGLSRLLTLANRENGHDNITAVLVRIKVQSGVQQ